IRAQRGLVLLLLAFAAANWWWTLERMDGMDAGPWTAFGGLSWFLATWIVMMAAMMVPSAIPTVALYRGLARNRAQLCAFLFVAGYLAVWAAVGVAAFGFTAAGGRGTDSVLARGRC